MILKLYTYFGLDSTRGQYYNVYIPTGDAQKEKYHVRRPAGTGNGFPICTVVMRIWKPSS